MTTIDQFAALVGGDQGLAVISVAHLYNLRKQSGYQRHRRAWTKTRPVTIAIGGAIVGLGVAAMHYTGMMALEVPARIEWAPALVASSVLIGCVLAALALLTAARGDSLRRMVLAAGDAEREATERVLKRYEITDGFRFAAAFRRELSHFAALTKGRR